MPFISEGIFIPASSRILEPLDKPQKASLKKMLFI
jgi:hypothetical protein